MNIEEKKAFYEAKCKELRSFFENGAREFSTTPEGKQFTI